MKLPRPTWYDGVRLGLSLFAGMSIHFIEATRWSATAVVLLLWFAILCVNMVEQRNKVQP